MLVRRAYLELAEGDISAARMSLRDALALRREQHDRRGVGLVLTGLGLIDTTRLCRPFSNINGLPRQSSMHLSRARRGVSFG